jgi:hypothetical protein
MIQRYVNFQSTATVPAAAVSIKQQPNNPTFITKASIVEAHQTSKQVLLQPIAAVVDQLQKVCHGYQLQQRHSNRTTHQSVNQGELLLQYSESCSLPAVVLALPREEATFRLLFAAPAAVLC